MDQPDMGNSTEAQPENPYGLRKGENGWSGSGPSFGVRYNVIKIKNSDANSNNMPEEEQRRRTVDEEGNFSQHVLLESGDDLYHLWMDKIGPYLGHWVLGKSRDASPPWRLLKFPEGYTLWLHKTGEVTDPANPRTDAYLHGAPHLGPRNSRSPGYPTVFRSPMEFVPHAIWLMNMKGGAETCFCKYCTPGQNQNDINARLDRERAPNNDDDDDDDDDSGGGNSRRGRGGGPGSQGRRRRRAKRERAPPVMAKDYRVGNNDSTGAA